MWNHENHYPVMQYPLQSASMRRHRHDAELNLSYLRDPTSEIVAYIKLFHNPHLTFNDTLKQTQERRISKQSVRHNYENNDVRATKESVF